jgi:hypothetical protein
MDTDELSVEAYRVILTESEKLSENLTLQFGLLSYNCKDENEYLVEAEKLVREIMSYDEYQLDDIFFGEVPNRKKLNLTLQKIFTGIEEVKKIPIDKRHYE